MDALFPISLRRSISLLALAAALGAASGCNQSVQTAANAAPPPGALPPVSMAAPLVDAPAAQALPAAQPPPIGHVASRRQGYAFADRAYAMSDAFSDAPPDYTYDYDGGRPWVWRSSDDSERVVEAVPGGERVYYYGPGSDQPFFVQDPEYGYGFENGALVTVYDRSGRELADAEAAARAEWAGRYLARARALYEASRREQREAVAEQNWQARRDYLAAQRQAWRQQQDQDADWRAYHEQYYPAEQAHYAAERQQRLAWAAHVDQMNNDQASAQREWAEAQREAHGGPPAAAYAPGSGAPGYSPNAQQQAPAQQQAARLAQQQAAQQQAAAQQAALGQAEQARRAQLVAQQQQSARVAAQQAARQQAARQAALGQAEAQRRAGIVAQQQQAQQQAAGRAATAAQVQAAQRAGEQQAAARQAALEQAEAQRRAAMVAQQQQAQRAETARRQAALQQQAAQRAGEQQAAAHQAALEQAEAQRRAALMAQRRQAAAGAAAQQAALRAQAAHGAQLPAAQQATQAEHARHPPKPSAANTATKQQ